MSIGLLAYCSQLLLVLGEYQFCFCSYQTELKKINKIICEYSLKTVTCYCFKTIDANISLTFLVPNFNSFLHFY